VTLVIPDVLEESCATRQARRRLPGITQKMLTETLRGMESDGLVERQVLKGTAPQHVEYRLTPLGKTLQEPLTAICTWAAQQASSSVNVG